MLIHNSKSQAQSQCHNQLCCHSYPLMWLSHCDKNQGYSISSSNQNETLDLSMLTNETEWFMYFMF